MRRNVLIETHYSDAVVAQYSNPPKGQHLKNTPLVIMPYWLQKTHEHTNVLFSNIAKKLESLGISSLLYDYSEQQKLNHTQKELCCEKVSNDLNAMFVWARENDFKDVAFVTEGLGAPLLFINFPENSVFTILLWPVLNIEELAKSIGSGEIRDELCVNDEFFETMKELDLRAALQTVHTPTLILHGRQDTVVPPIHLEEARAHLMAPRLDITTFEDGGHGLISPNHEKACLQHITNFVKKYAQKDSKRIELFRI